MSGAWKMQCQAEPNKNLYRVVRLNSQYNKNILRILSRSAFCLSLSPAKFLDFKDYSSSSKLHSVNNQTVTINQYRILL